MIKSPLIKQDIGIGLLLLLILVNGCHVRENIRTTNIAPKSASIEAYQKIFDHCTEEFSKNSDSFDKYLQQKQLDSAYYYHGKEHAYLEMQIFVNSTLKELEK